jgi:hypothetical protein
VSGAVKTAADTALPISERIAEAKKFGAKGFAILISEYEELVPPRGAALPLAQRKVAETAWEAELRHTWAYQLAYQLGYPKETDIHSAVAKVIAKEVAEILVHYGTRKP